MSFLKKMFGDNKQTIYAPVSGQLIALKNVPDDIFSAKILGDGIAVEPEEDIIASPIDGTILHISDTLHAVGVSGKNGMEIMLHIGIDTVNLGGKFFESFVQAGEKVKKGQKLIHFNRTAIKEAGYPITTMLIITGGEYEKLEKEAGDIKSGEKVIVVYDK